MLPTVNPTENPSRSPTVNPTRSPTQCPTVSSPTVAPSTRPSKFPTSAPTLSSPTASPTVHPTFQPSTTPTTGYPSGTPSSSWPTGTPTTPEPTFAPHTSSPSATPSTSTTLIPEEKAYFELSFTENGNCDTINAMQLADINFYLEGTRLIWTGANNALGVYVPSQDPRFLEDDDPSTKHQDLFASCRLGMSITGTVAYLPDFYDFRTANDRPSRDPRSWRLKICRESDGTCRCSNKNGYAPPTARSSWYGGFELPPCECAMVVPSTVSHFYTHDDCRFEAETNTLIAKFYTNCTAVCTYGVEVSTFSCDQDGFAGNMDWLDSCPSCEVTAEAKRATLHFEADYHSIISTQRHFLDECNLRYRPATCISVEPGSIILTVEGRDAVLLNTVLDIYTNGLSLPSYPKLFAVSPNKPTSAPAAPPTKLPSFTFIPSLFPTFSVPSIMPTKTPSRLPSINPTPKTTLPVPEIQTFTTELHESNLRYTSVETHESANKMLFSMMIVFGVMVVLLCCIVVFLIRMWMSHRSLEQQLQFGDNSGGNLQEEDSAPYKKAINRRPNRPWPSIRVERAQRAFDENVQRGEVDKEGIEPGSATTRFPGSNEEQAEIARDNLMTREQHSRTKSLFSMLADRATLKKANDNVANASEYVRKSSPRVFEMKVFSRESEGKVSHPMTPATREVTPTITKRQSFATNVTYSDVDFSTGITSEESSQPGGTVLHRRSPARHDSDLTPTGLTDFGMLVGEPEAFAFPEIDITVDHDNDSHGANNALTPTSI